MALVHCGVCGKKMDSRQMSPCVVCGTLLCAACAHEREGCCGECLQDMDDMNPTRLL